MPTRITLRSLMRECYYKYPLTSIIKIRKLVSCRNREFIFELINFGVISQIISLLTNNNYNFHFLLNGYTRQMIDNNIIIPLAIINIIQSYIIIHNIDETLQIEGRWILFNIFAETCVEVENLIDQRLISMLMNGLKKKTTIAIKCISIEALGNIIGTKTKRNLKCKNMLLNAKLLNTLFTIAKQLIKRCKDLSLYDPYDKIEVDNLLTGISYLIRNLCYEFNEFTYLNIIEIMNILVILKNYNNTMILQNVMYSLSYISKKSKFAIAVQDNLFRLGFVHICINCLLNESFDITSAAMICINNIICTSDNYSVRIINSELFSKLFIILTNEHNIYPLKLQQTACWLISNIASGPMFHVKTLISSGLMKIIMRILYDGPNEIGNEALWIIYNAIQTETKSMHTIQNDLNKMYNFMIDNKIMHCLLGRLLKIRKENNLRIALIIINELFQYDNTFSNNSNHNKACFTIFKEYCGFCYLRGLVNNNNKNYVTQKIKLQIKKIIVKWNK